MTESYESEHDALTKVAVAQHCTDPLLCASVSRHQLPNTASFKNIEALHGAASKGTCFVGTLGKDLVFSAMFGDAEGNSDQQPPPSKKRRRHADADQAERRVQVVARG